MRIVFFTENTLRGGLDSFIVTLLRNWPVPDDELILMCNRSHPGLSWLTARLGGSARVVPLDLPFSWIIQRRLAGWTGRRLARLLSPALKYYSFIRLVAAIKRILLACDADRVMVVNGGYPAGDSCRAATIAWNLVRSGHPRAVHNVHNLAYPARWWERFPEWLIDREVANATTAFVAVSGACAAALTANRPVVAGRAPVTHIYNSIERVMSAQSSSADFREKLSIPHQGPLCAMLAVYEPRKGHDFVIRAWARVNQVIPDAQLLICGDGSAEDRARVAALVEEAGLKATVHLRGFIEDVNLPLSGTAILLMASQRFESFGLSLVEAMARRIPVVGTAVGGIPEVIGNGDSAAGFVVDRQDHHTFAACIISLLRDEELRRRFGEKGFVRYSTRFTADRMAASYAALIRDGRFPGKHSSQEAV